MSKSNLGHDLPQDQLIPEDELLAQRSSKVPSKPKRDRDSVTPFAKDMIDNVVAGAVSILGNNRKEGKPWIDVLSANRSPLDLSSSQDIRSMADDSMDSVSQENQISNSLPSADTQLPVIQVMHLQVRDDVACDSFHAEQVARIVKGLQDIQIGDSPYVLPVDGSNIENQVKKAVRNINNLEFGDMETPQLIICDGQGDVDSGILKAEVGPPTNTDYKPENDASKISTCFLHKMIEELEENDSTTRDSCGHGNKEGIASWEESEEKLIRIIEGPDDETGPSFSEYQGYFHSAIFDQESLTLGTENYAASKNGEDFLGQSHQAFMKEEVIDDRDNDNRLQECSDNYTDEDPYWSTAGLITRVVQPQPGTVLLNRTTMAEHESSTSSLGGNLQVGRTGTSIRESLSVAEYVEGEPQAKDEDSKLKEKKKTCFGKKIRTFFLRFKRNRNG